MESKTSRRNLQSKPISITNVQTLASYNWVDSDVPTIVVPGMPAKWLDRKDSPHLEPDSGVRYTDQNAGRYPQSPMEPGIRAVLQLQPGFNFTGLHLITDRYALASLLELTNQKQSGGEETLKSFNFGAQVVNSTIVFFRSDEVPKEQITRFCGIRRDFGQQYLSYPKGMKDSVSHHRIIKYRLGELQIVLRHGADGFMEDDSPELEEAYKSFQEEYEATKYGNLTVRSAGCLVPLSTMLELNTIKKKYQDPNTPNPRIETKFRDTWLSQSPYYMVAKYVARGHWSGSFENLRGRVKPSDLNLYPDSAAGSGASSWEERHQELVKEFYSNLQDLIKDIHSAAETEECQTFVVEKAEDTNEVTITPSRTLPALSEEMCERLKAPEE